MLVLMSRREVLASGLAMASAIPFVPAMRTAATAEPARLRLTADTRTLAVNGKPARGGSMDVAGPAIVNGMLFVNSGYGQWGGMPGNVLLDFSADGK